MPRARHTNHKKIINSAIYDHEDQNAHSAARKFASVLSRVRIPAYASSTRKWAIHSQLHRLLCTFCSMLRFCTFRILATDMTLFAAYHGTVHHGLTCHRHNKVPLEASLTAVKSFPSDGPPSHVPPTNPAATTEPSSSATTAAIASYPPDPSCHYIHPLFFHIDGSTEWFIGLMVHTMRPDIYTTRYLSPWFRS